MPTIVRRLRQGLQGWIYDLPAPRFARMLTDFGHRTLRNFGRNDGSLMAAGMAYYTVFSLFPLALGAIFVGSFFVSSDEAQVRLFEFLDDQFPGVGDSEILRENIRGLVQARIGVGLVSLVGLFWAGRAVFGALHRTLNRAWRVAEPRHFLIQQVRQLGMALAVGLAFLASVFISTFGQVVGEGPGVLGVEVGFFVWAWALLFGLVPLFLSTSVFMLLYRFVPNARVRWRHVVPGALLAGILFEASKAGFVLYLDNFASFDRIYGSISAMVVLLLWAYVASLILVIGAEVASEYGRSHEGGQIRFHGNLRFVKGGFRPQSTLTQEE